VKRLLITGGSGYLGSHLANVASHKWSVLYTWLNRPVSIANASNARLDILDINQVKALFQGFRPEAVVHTAYSQTNLDVIVNGTSNIVAACDEIGVRLVHLSTDAVFNGEGSWYSEGDSPAPVHPYGRAKLESEKAVLGSSYNRNAVVVRTSLIWGIDPMDKWTRYIKDMLEKRELLILYDDEYRCPIRVDELAQAILELVDLEYKGIIHVAGPDRLSRYEFGRMIAISQGWNTESITSGPNSMSGTVRPRDCSLNCSLARKLLRTRISSPKELLTIR